jgi:cbb3-type cytochrome oxidase subunit 3
MVQKAGNATCGLAKDNLFIFVVIMCLILFLIWCYVEKQRQNAIYEKYLQKKLAKSLLNDELNLFTETPNPINVEKLFVDINESLVETINPEPEQEPVVEKNPVNYVSKDTNNNLHMTKREQNLQIYDSNQRIPNHMNTKNQSIPLAGNDVSSKYMDINNFSGSYMLM